MPHHASGSGSRRSRSNSRSTTISNTSSSSSSNKPRAMPTGMRDSCDRCHELKTRCVRAAPERHVCQRCDRLGLACSYSPPGQTGRPRANRKGRASTKAMIPSPVNSSTTPPAESLPPQEASGAPSSSVILQSDQQQQQQQQQQAVSMPSADKTIHVGHAIHHQQQPQQPSSTAMAEDFRSVFCNELDMSWMENMFDMSHPMNGTDALQAPVVPMPVSVSVPQPVVVPNPLPEPTDPAMSSTITAVPLRMQTMPLVQERVLLSSSQAQVQLDLLHLQSTLVHVAKAMTEGKAILPHLDRIFNVGERLISLSEAKIDGTGDIATSHPQAAASLLSVCCLTMADIACEAISRLRDESQGDDKTDDGGDPDWKVTIGSTRVTMSRRVAAEAHLPLVIHLHERVGRVMKNIQGTSSGNEEWRGRWPNI